MSYHSWREKLGNYLQIKVMLSDSSPHKYTTTVHYSARRRERLQKQQNEVKTEARQIEAVALYISKIQWKNAMINFNKRKRRKQSS